jgi:superfamily II DNA or RNA helicase
MDQNQEQNQVQEEEKLLSYQIPHKMQLHECLLLRNRVIDASDTGAGKTYVAISECKDLKLRPFIICPKSVISVWVDVCKLFGVEYLGIANYEMLKGCKYYNLDYEATKCPYMDLIFENVEDKKKKNIKEKEKNKIVLNMGKKISMENKLKHDSAKKNDHIIDDEEENGDDNASEDSDIKTSKKVRYQFYLPDDVIVIFDEAHRCKNLTSQTSKLLLGLSECKNKIMILSATITDKIKCFKPFGIFFGFYLDPKQFNMWINKLYKINKNKYQKSETSDSDLIKLDIIHHKIFPNYGSRIRISELGDLFPKNQIIASCYYLENHAEIEKVYNEINNALAELATKEHYALPLPALIYCRQKIEMLKVTLFMDLANEHLEDGYSVVIFVNYLETMNYLCYHMKKEIDKYGLSIIVGGQTISERKANIDDFQNNTNKFCISTLESGGIGISLHDIHGGHPRVSLISPSWTSISIRQACGRIHRAGAKTPALQKIVYVAKTYEEDICKLIKAKLTVIDSINDGDLAGPNIPKEVLEELNKPATIDENKIVADNIAGKVTKEDLEDVAPIEERIKQVKKKQYKTSNKDTKKTL